MELTTTQQADANTNLGQALLYLETLRQYVPGLIDNGAIWSIDDIALQTSNLCQAIEDCVHNVRRITGGE